MTRLGVSLVDPTAPPGRLAAAAADPDAYMWAWDDPTTHLVIFDGSYSMNQGEGEDQATEPDG